MAHRFAEAGFIVVAPHYRGSNGWAGKDELGGAELHDLMNLPCRRSRAFPAPMPRVCSSRASRAAARWCTWRCAMASPRGPRRCGARSRTSRRWSRAGSAGQRRRRRSGRSTRTTARQLYRHALGAALRGSHRRAHAHHAWRRGRRYSRCRSRSAWMPSWRGSASKHEFIVFEGEQHVIGGRGAERDAATIAWFQGK